MNHVGGVDQGRSAINPIPVNPRRPMMEDSDDEDDLDHVIANPGGKGVRRNEQKHNHWGNNEYKLKVDIPTFSGDLDIKGFLDWITKVNHFFKYIEIAEERQVKLVAYQLKGGAFVWWEQLRET